MVSDASNLQTLKWIGVAFVIHLLLVFATSYDFIRDHWLDPQGAVARAQAETAKDQPQSAPASSAQATAAPQPQSSPKPASPADDEKALLESKKDNPEVKKITETAKPNEIPKTPTHDGFNIDDSLK